MRGYRTKSFLLHSCVLIVFIVHATKGSECPMASKPHPADCRRFYRCVRLPTATSGYVWVPSKCGHNMLYQSELGMCVMPGNQELSHLCRPSMNYQQSMPEFPLTSITTQNMETNEYGSGDDDMGSTDYDSSYDSDQTEDAGEIREPELFLQFTTTTENPKPTENPNSVMHVIAQQLQRITQLIESLQRRPTETNDPTAAQMNSIVAQNQIAAGQLPWQVAPQVHQHHLRPDGSLPQGHMQQILNHQYTLQELADDQNKILSLGSGQHQFVTFDQYKESILPVLQGAPVQVLPCTAGLRQPNLTDCTRYYVCNQESATVFMFECPRETAFNGDTRMCTAAEFDRCRRPPPAPNVMMMMAPMQQIVHQPAMSQSVHQMMQHPVQILPQQYVQRPMQQIYQQHPPPAQQSNSQSVQVILEEKSSEQTTQTMVRCNQLGKLPDPNSIHDYYVCYRAKSGAIEAHKMTCQKPLRFCAVNSVCTTPERCK